MSNLALVKPEKANAVENYLIQMARFGKLGAKVKRLCCAWSTDVVNILPNARSAMNRCFFLLSDFGVRLDRDSRKSQSANRQEDDCHSKFH